MCGIVGVIDLQRRRRLPEPARFDAMVDALARRGPDGRGVWRHDDVAFGHRRLAIIDTSDASSQPFVRDGVALVFNGEIYNFKALRRELEAIGHAFTTSGDTEVLWASYRQWGPRCVDRLNGIFAFVVVDTTATDGDAVFVARDHTGIKPLFYRLDDGLLWFASELKAILKDPRVPRRPDPEALDCFFAHSWIPSPLTPFAGIAQLPPATTMSLSFTAPSRPPVFRRYWRPVAQERTISLDDAAAELDERLQASVSAQLVSDVPLGAFLSGGLDSSSVVAAMRREGQVRTFSMGFTEASFDESEDAAHTASVLGADHHSERVDLDLAATALSVAETNDDLLADASILAVDRLCALTRRHVTVALSGDGADEILGGYPTYTAAHLARGWRHLPGPLRSLAVTTATALPATTTRYSLRDFALRFLAAAEQGPSSDFASFRLFFDEASRRRLLKGHTDGHPITRYARAVDEAWGETLLKRLLIADLTHYLPADMLVKVDRASMRHGLEVRVPFLDPDFIDFALSLPSSLLVSPTGVTKKVLRRHVEQRVSPRIAKGKKRGFSVPVGAAFKGALGDLLLAELGRDVIFDGPVDVGEIRRVLDEHRRGVADHGLHLYTTLVYCLWWRRFIVDEAL